MKTVSAALCLLHERSRMFSRPLPPQESSERAGFAYPGRLHMSYNFNLVRALADFVKKNGTPREILRRVALSVYARESIGNRLLT